MVKQQLKSKIRRFPKFYAISKLISNVNKNAFIDYINGYDGNPDILEITPGNSNEYEGRAVCEIVTGTRADGFFACLRWALDGVFFCDRMGFIPIVRFPEDSVYKDLTLFENDVNVFNYFFELSNNLDEKNISEAPHVRYAQRNMLLAENLNGGISYQVSGEYISEMAKIFRKYFTLKENTLALVEKQIEELGVDASVLAVHVRGTDYRENYKNHPIFVEPKQYFLHIDKALKEYGFDKIFLATDDDDILEEFQKYYKNRLIYDKSTSRTRGNTGVHMSDISEKSPYYLAIDVISDMISMSKCGGLISGYSQVPLISRIYKKSMDEAYMYDEYISNGINKKGKVFI